jgi:hypothetical protein
MPVCVLNNMISVGLFTTAKLAEIETIAAYKGLWQLIYKPFYWEKTNHGLSKVSQSASAANTAEK